MHLLEHERGIHTNRFVMYGAEVAEVRFRPCDASRLMGEPGESKRFNANMMIQAGIAPMVSGHRC